MITIHIPPTAPAAVHAAIEDALAARKITDKSKSIFKALKKGDAVPVRDALDATFDVMTQSITRFGYSSQRHVAAEKHEALYTWLRAAEQFAAADGETDVPGVGAIEQALEERAKAEKEAYESRQRQFAESQRWAREKAQLERTIRDLEAGRGIAAEKVRADRLEQLLAESQEQLRTAREQAEELHRFNMETIDMANARSYELHSQVRDLQDTPQEVTIPAGANVVINAKKVIVKSA